MEKDKNDVVFTSLDNAKILTNSGSYAIINCVIKQPCGKYLCHLKNDVQLSSVDMMSNKIFIEEIGIILELE